MIKKLQRRLAIVFACITGGVLATALGLALWSNIQQIFVSSDYELYWRANEAQLKVMNSLYSDGAELYEQGYLAEFERELQIAILIKLNDQPVLFDVGYDLGTPRDEVWGMLEDIVINATDQDAAEEIVSLDGLMFEAGPMDGTEEEVEQSQSSETEQEKNSVVVRRSSASSIIVMESMVASQIADFPDGSSYRFVTMGWRDQSNEVSMMVLQNRAPEKQKILYTSLAFVGIFIAGLGLLWLVSNIFVRRLLKPTAQGLQKQADFVAAASHELRSPLTVVRASLAAAETAESEAEAEKFRHAAADEAERMSRLVDDLLLLAGGDTGKWKVQQGSMDMDTILIETAEKYTPLAKRQDVEIVLDLPEETLPSLPGDSDRMKQVLGVLLDNALQYAPAGSCVRLSAKLRKNKVEVKVEDQGPGLVDEEKERVFERFYRSDKSRKDKQHFGLGLAVAAELIELHGGSISVQDTEGGGATFTILLAQ